MLVKIAWIDIMLRQHTLEFALESCICMNDVHFTMDFNDETWKEYAWEKVL